jgi:hypothetical protein
VPSNGHRCRDAHTKANVHATPSQYPYGRTDADHCSYSAPDSHRYRDTHATPSQCPWRADANPAPSIRAAIKQVSHPPYDLGKGHRQE